MPRKLLYSMESSSDSSSVFYNKGTNTDKSLVLGNSQQMKNCRTSKNGFTQIFSYLFICVYNLFKIQIKALIKLYLLTSRIILLDTRLLQRICQRRKIGKLLILFVVSFLFLGGWWVLTNMELLGTKTNSTLVDIYDGTEPLLSHNISENSSVTTQDKNTTKMFEKDSVGTQLNNNELKYVIKEIKQSVNIDNIVEDIIKSTNFKNILNNYPEFLSINSDLNKSRQQTKTLLKEIALLKNEMVDVRTFYENKMTDLLRQIETRVIHKRHRIIHELNQCCKTLPMIIKQYIHKSVTNSLKDENYLRKTDLHNSFATKKDVELLLSLQDEKFNKIISDKNEMVQVDTKTTEVTGNTIISVQQVEKIVKNLLTLYDADKTGLVDYAVEVIGGQILTTRCTEPHKFGKSPKNIITPTATLGDCWAFQNFPGSVVIKLAKEIEIEAFSLEHISKLLVPNGKIESAPREFEIYGLRDQYDQEPIKLGEYVYDNNGEALQFFNVQNSGQTFRIIELIVNSNYGNPNYTCLYRFRVHGKLIE